MRYILIYGSLSGLVIIFTIMAGVLFSPGSFMTSVVFGYLVMLVALAFIFVGVKRYRDIERGGIVGFWRAFGLGLGIAALAAVIYVGVWEAYLASTDYRFIGEYTAQMIEAKQKTGISAEALAAYKAEMAELEKGYANPLFRLPMTFLEIFPVGLLVALISAAVLRNPRMLPAKVAVRAATT